MAASSRPSARLRFGLGVTAGLGAGAALLLLAPPLTRRTESQEVNVFFHTFQDTRGVTVLSPMVDLSKDFTDRTSIKAKFGVDAISASSDSCARCHPNGARNGRVVGSLTVNRKYGETTVGVGAELSH